MKISVDDKLLFELSETQKKVIKNDISSDIFDADMKRRLEYVIMHRYDQGFARLKRDWEPVLSVRESTLPLEAEAFVALVKAQQDYKDKFDRDTPVEPKVIEEIL